MPSPYNYFPATYPGAYNPYPQGQNMPQYQANAVPQMQQPVQMTQQNQPMQAVQQQQMAQPQIQNGGLVSVRGRSEAQNYPVAPGNSVTFKDETAPYVYTKTMGFSQLDRPVFETFRLVKEETSENSSENHAVNKSEAQTVDFTKYATKAEIEPILARLEALEAERPKKTTKKREENDDV